MVSNYILLPQMQNMKKNLKLFFSGIIVSSMFWVVILFNLLPGNVNNNGMIDKNPIRFQSRMQHLKKHREVALIQSLLASSDRKWKDEASPNYGNVTDNFKFWQELKNQSNSKLEQHRLNKLNQGIDIRRTGTASKMEEEPLGKIFNNNDKEKLDAGQRRYAFNLLVSDRIGHDREIPDTRHSKCLRRRYHAQLTTAVIICFYNEALSTLLRTVYSVLKRTDHKLLSQIILVDDASDDGVGDEVDKHFSSNTSSKVHIIHNKQREGLIRARNIGARHAAADVLMYLDSHCEVNVGWLPPLLQHLQLPGKAHVAVPVIDKIDDSTLQYSASKPFLGGFTWGLQFRWDPVMSFNKTLYEWMPYRTPTMAGGLFAMLREEFFRLGAYDDGMDIWGAENLEMSFRVWTCGGDIHIIPCSRAGHIYRRRRPYGNPRSLSGTDVLARNNRRLADVWLDEYKEKYFEAAPRATSVSAGDVQSRVQLRRSLQCKPFKWYMNNVYSHMDEVDHIQIQQALLERKEMERSKKLLQDLELLSDRSIRLKSSRLCLEARDKLYFFKCSGEGVQIWTLTPVGLKAQLFNAAAGMCLAVDRQQSDLFNEQLIKQASLTMQICDTGHESQIFQLKYKAKKS